MDNLLVVLCSALVFSSSTAFLFKPAVSYTFVRDALNFTVLGDFGGLPFYPYESPFEYEVSKGMGKFCREHGCQFNMALGDNFYFHGVQNVDDPRFQQTFESVFKDQSLQNPWYLVAGNHDHYGNVSAQIAYTKKSERWNFPDLYYNLTMPIPNSDRNLDIVMLDTITLCGNTKADSHPAPPPGPEDVPRAETQWTWLEDKLRNSRGLYLIVAGHFPVWSIAEHGPTSCLVERLMPLLHKYNVTAYMSGHDHNLQHLQHTLLNRTVDYYVSGAANVVDPRTNHKASVPAGALKYHGGNILSMGGFAFVQADQRSMKLTFVDAWGTILYTHEMLPRS